MSKKTTLELPESFSLYSKLTPVEIPLAPCDQGRKQQEGKEGEMTDDMHCICMLLTLKQFLWCSLLRGDSKE